MVYRVYVEKIEGQTHEADSLLKEVKDFLQITSLESVRVLNRYDVENISDETIDKHLCTNFMPDPELMIRTGGEVRLSNYLLWQCAYSELYFCDTYWPDFKEEEFCKAICDYQKRERRFGKTSEQI